MPAAKEAILGLDVGGTKLAAGVLHRTGRLLSWRRVATPLEQGPDGVLAALVELGRAAVDDAGLTPGSIAAVGVGCGGPLDAAEGVVLGPPNLPGWDHVPIVAELERAFAAPACLENDGNAAALGELAFGAGRGLTDLVFLTISTGVGGGVVSGGRLLRGRAGNAAELGHLVVAMDGRACGCGGRGCLEAYASGTSIALRAREALERGERSILPRLAAGLPQGVTSETVVAGVRAGDALAERIWDETIVALGAGLASAIHAFNPQVVVLGGGVAAAGELLLEPLRREVAARTMSALGTQVVAAALGERLGVYGAAAVAGERLGLGPWREREGPAPQRSLEPATPAASAASPLTAVARAGLGVPQAGLGVPPEPARLGRDAPAGRPGLPPAGSATERVDRDAEARCLAAASEHIEVATLVRDRLLSRIDAVGEILCAALGSGGRLIAFGNGGSAADAQHFVAELIGHYRRERAPLPALALTSDPSVVTCISNDYGFEDVFARQIEALAGPDDVVFGISTSGNAANVVRGLLAARLRGATTVALVGGSGGSAGRVAEHVLAIPSTRTARIQEMHTLIVHLLSERVDEWAASDSAADPAPARSPFSLGSAGNAEPDEPEPPVERSTAGSGRERVEGPRGRPDGTGRLES